MLEARYIQAGKTIAFNFYFKAGSTSTFGSGGILAFTLPVAARFTADFSQINFPAVYHDAGSASYFGCAQVGATATSNTVADFVVWATTGSYTSAAGVTNAAPFTWTTSDKLQAWGVYESA